MPVTLPPRSREHELAALRSRCLQQEGAARARDKELGRAGRQADIAKVSEGMGDGGPCLLVFSTFVPRSFVSQSAYGRQLCQGFSYDWCMGHRALHNHPCVTSMRSCVTLMHPYMQASEAELAAGKAEAVAQAARAEAEAAGARVKVGSSGNGALG